MSIPHSLSVLARGLRLRNGGFTLIELVISVVLLGLLAAVGTSMISDSFTTTRLVDASESNAAQARYALERLEREIREARYTSGAYSVSTMTASRLVFTRSDGITVTIDKTGSNLTLGYSTPATTSTLSDHAANNAGSVPMLAYLDTAGVATVSTSALRFVVITLTVTDPTSGQSVLQRTRVALRNA